MKTKCVPCLGSDVKEAIRTLRLSVGDKTVEIDLENIPDCGDPLALNLCIKPPRAKSGYQIFISECMKSKPIKGKPFGAASAYMKECAVEWRARKEEVNSNADANDNPL